MNPDLQDDFDPSETFAGRLAALDELRRSSTNADWRDKAINDALEGGKYLERRFHDFTLAINQKVSDKASAEVQSEVLLRLQTLEGAAERSRGVLGWVLEHSWQGLMLIAAVAVGHWWR